VALLEEQVHALGKGLVRQQEEVEKVRELNDYLMGQLLVMFEKMGELESKEDCGKMVK
jgi:uncharacterized coiled-coil protein SlyX